MSLFHASTCFDHKLVNIKINILRCMVSKLSKIDGNVTLWKLNYTRAVYIFTQNLISHTFPPLCTLLYNMSQKTEETTHFQYKHIFYDQDHIRWISNFYYNYTGKLLTSDREIKQHIWQWTGKEDCSTSEVPYVILIILMTIVTT